MQIQVNGQPRDIATGATVAELLHDLNLGTTLVAVERNALIIPRAEHATTTLTENDAIEVVHFVGGG